MKLLGLLCLALLFGCSTPTKQPPFNGIEQPLSSHQQGLSQLESWEISGRIIITLDDESWNANLRWDQQHDRFNISLNAPMGQGSMRLTGAPGRTTLETSDGGFATAPDPETLLYDQFGLEVPLSALRYWMIGLPTPGYHRQQLDQQGHMVALEQHNWQLRINKYRQYGAYQLPGRLFLKGDEGEVKVAITRWTLKQTEGINEHL